MYIYTSFVYAGIYYKDKHKEPLKCYSKNKQITYHPPLLFVIFFSVITACGHRWVQEQISQ